MKKITILMTLLIMSSCSLLRKLHGKPMTYHEKVNKCMREFMEIYATNIDLTYKVCKDIYKGK